MLRLNRLAVVTLLYFAALGVGGCHEHVVNYPICGGTYVPVVYVGDVFVESIQFQPHAGGATILPPPFALACRPAYVYPEAARKARMQGRVVLGGRLNASGELEDLRLITGVNPLLDRAALTGSRDWHFQASPTQFLPEAAYFEATVCFRLL